MQSAAAGAASTPINSRDLLGRLIRCVEGLRGVRCTRLKSKSEIPIPMPKSMTTVQRHILEQERAHPQSTGDLTGLLWDLSIAAKVISHQVNRGGLADIFGETGEANV